MKITSETPAVTYKMVIELNPAEVSRILADLGEADERDCLDYPETRSLFEFLERLS